MQWFDILTIVLATISAVSIGYYYLIGGRKATDQTEIFKRLVELLAEQNVRSSRETQELVQSVMKGQDFGSFFKNMERFELLLRRNELLSQRQMDLLEELAKQQRDLTAAIQGNAAPAPPNPSQNLEEKLQYISTVTSDVAHTLGTPISGLKVALELLKNDLNGQGGERIKSLENGIRTIEDTIEGYSQLGLKAVTPTNQSVKLKDALEASFNLLALSVSKKVNLSFSIPDDIVIPRDLYRSLLIPISSVFQNGLEAVEDNGSVKISATERENSLIIDIYNSGRPIDSAVGDIYKRGLSTKGSSGIGLTVAKQIVEETFKGKISHRNVEGGVVFTIEIPRWNYAGQ